MLSTKLIAVMLLTLALPAILAQQLTPSTITNEMLALDANEYPEFNSGLTAEQLVAEQIHFDPVQNAYLLTSHPNEERRFDGEGKQDALSDFRQLTYNSDAAVLATPTCHRSALTASHKFIFRITRPESTPFIVRRRKF